MQEFTKVMKESNDLMDKIRAYGERLLKHGGVLKREEFLAGGGRFIF